MLIDYSNIIVENQFTNPYRAFFVKNFFNIDFYKKLKIDMINSQNEYKFFKKTDNKKFNITSEDYLYSSFIEKFESFKIINDLVFSKKFVNFFLNYFYFDILRTFVDRPKVLNILRPKLISEKKIVSNYKDLFFCKIKPNIQFSYIHNYGSILPHVDSNSKLLTLMLYIPEFNSYDELFNKEKKIGTDLIILNKKNIKNEKKILSEKIDFKRVKIDFSENIIHGFVKNSKSWHSLSSVDVSKGYIRKSININLNL
jgi:hypothetical protein